MIRVGLRRFGEADPVPTWLDGAVRTVPAASFVGDVDQGQGGITRADIVDETMIAPLSTYAVGVEVYIESEDASKSLFDETPETEHDSHIWWLATVLAPAETTSFEESGEDHGQGPQ